MIHQTPSMNPVGTTYVAKHDVIGAFVPLQNRRRFLVIKYRDGKFCYVCSAFASLAPAEKRAAYLNQHHASCFVKQEG